MDPASANETAPDRFSVILDTTKGDITIDVDRALAPLGADRFYNLVRAGFYEDVAFFRVISGFMAQTGLHGDPAVNKLWRDARIADDPVKTSNTEGTVTFATSGPNARTTQIFINYRNNGRLDAMGFAPFGRVREMTVVDQIHSAYGEQPQQGRIHREGNQYLRTAFPDLDYIKSARLI